MWRNIRIGVLLLVLLTVAQRAWLQTRVLDWRNNLYVAIYPNQCGWQQCGERLYCGINS